MAMYDYVYEKDFRELSDWVKKTIPYSVTYEKFDVKKNLEDIVEKDGPFEEDTTLWCKDGEDMHIPSMYTFLTSLAYIYSYIRSDVRSYVSENFSSIGHKHTRSDITNFDHTHSIADIYSLTDTLLYYATAIETLGYFNSNDSYIVSHSHTKSDITDFAHTHADLANEINDIKNKLSYIEGQHIKINNYKRYVVKNGKTYKCGLHFYYKARDGKYHSDAYGEGAITLDILMVKQNENATATVRAQWATCVSNENIVSPNDPNIKIYAAVNRTGTSMSLYDIPSKYNFATAVRGKTVDKNGTNTTMYHRSLRYYYDVANTTSDNTSQDIYVTDLNPLSTAKNLELAYDLTEQEVTTASAAPASSSPATTSNFVEEVGEEKLVASFTGDADLSQYI